MSVLPEDVAPGSVWGSAEYERLRKAGLRQTEGGKFSLVSNECWRPGIFASEKAARMGQRLSDEQIQALQDEVNAREADPINRFITEEMIVRSRTP